MRIVIIDHEQAYRSQLKRLIEHTYPELEVHVAAWPEQAMVQLAAGQTQKTLILHSQTLSIDMPGSGEAVLPEMRSEMWTYCHLQPGSPSVHASRTQSLHRLGSGKEILAFISDWMNRQASSEQGEKHQICLLVRLDQDPGKQEARNQLLDIRKRGFRAVYLPLMPNYLMHLAEPPDRGPNLSDLLMHLIADPEQPLEIGHYWQAVQHGWLQFRPPNRSDDIVQCEPALLQTLVRCLCQGLEKNMENTHVLIECQAIALAAIRSVAVLCHTCKVILPQGRRYALDAARQEMNQLLNELPACCRVNGNDWRSEEIL